MVAVVGFQFGLYHAVVPWSVLRSISLVSFFFSLLFYFWLTRHLKILRKPAACRLRFLCIIVNCPLFKLKLSVVISLFLNLELNESLVSVFDTVEQQHSEKKDKFMISCGWLKAVTQTGLKHYSQIHPQSRLREICSNFLHFQVIFASVSITSLLIWEFAPDKIYNLRRLGDEFTLSDVNMHMVTQHTPERSALCNDYDSLEWEAV